MPFVKVKVNRPVSPSQEVALKRRMGAAIGVVPGKSEASLLTEIEDDCRMWLAGDDTQAICYIEAALFGCEDHVGFPGLTRELASAVHDVVGVPRRNVYVKSRTSGPGASVAATSTGGMF